MEIIQGFMRQDSISSNADVRNGGRVVSSANCDTIRNDVLRPKVRKGEDPLRFGIHY
jgi:hypothetical protein